MIRGTKLFKCNKCGNKFLAPDIEFQATILTTPQRCPKCESIRTSPWLSFWNKKAYEKIWAQMENK